MNYETLTLLIVSSVHSVHLVGLTCISTCKIPLNTISKISDIFNSSLQKPIDFICIFCIRPTLIYSLGFKIDLARTSLCSLPRQGFCVTQHLCLMYFQLQDQLH